MKTHSRRLSMALAIVMVLSLLVAFPAVVSAADTNLAVGLTPTALSADGNTEVGFLHASGAQALTAMTDGSDYGSVQAQTVEFLGSNRVWNLTFTLAEASTISSIVVYYFDGVTSTLDDTRGWNADTFAVTIDGVAVTGTGVSTSGLAYGYVESKYTYTLSTATAGTTVKISASSPVYVLAIGEIEIMGSVGTSGESGGGSTDTPVVTPGESANYIAGLTATSVFDNIYHGAEATAGYLNGSGAQTYAVLTDGANASVQAEALELNGTASVWDFTYDMGEIKTDISSVVVYGRNSYIDHEDVRAFDSSKIVVQVSTDNATWTTAAGSYVEETVDGYTTLKVTYTLNAAATAQYIKITLAPTNAYVLAVGEIEVWGGTTSGGGTTTTDAFSLAMTASDAQYNGADCVAVDFVVNDITDKGLLGLEFDVAFDASVFTPVLDSEGGIYVETVAGPFTENLSAVYTAGANTANVQIISDVDAYASTDEYYASAVTADGAAAIRIYFTSTVAEGASTSVAVSAPLGMWIEAADGGYVEGSDASATYTAPVATVYYTVTFVAAEGGTLSGTTSVSVEAGTDLSTVTFPTTTANTGYDFVAWDKTSGAINSDTTVTASFAIKTFTVTFVAGANGTLSGTTTATVNYGTDLSAVTFPTPVANDGYEFVAWDKTSGAITADTTVTASFQATAVEPDDPTVADFTLTDAATTAGYSVATGRAAANAANTYLYGLKATNTATTVTAADIKALFVDAVSVTNASGTALADTATISTGVRVYNAAGDKYIELVMIGDTRGSGRVATVNVTFMKRHIASPSFAGAFLEAADVNYNGTFSVTTADVTMTKRVINGSRTF